MTTQHARLTAASPDETSLLAQKLGSCLRPGDVVLMQGGIGAGKTHFARSLIQSLQDHPEDVPSPTFTLVQVYETRAGELWHADLYRLGSPDECVELGLADAFETAICLIEWPERLEDLAPQTALHLHLIDSAQNDSRDIVFSWASSRWTDVISALRT